MKYGAPMRTKAKPKSNHDSIEQLRSFLEERGSEAQNVARDYVLRESFDCGIVREALRYFMSEYWQNYSTPTLLYLACEAAGGESKRLTDLASAMIIVNGAIDIHDDIVDHSKRKDGRPTVYGGFGKEIALLIGDALFTKGFMKLAEACQAFGEKQTRKIFSIMKCGLFELGEAEVLEIGFRHRVNITPEEYLKVMHKKAADVEALMRIGAFLGDSSTEEMEILGAYGRIVGILSIVRDDVLDTILLEELKHRTKYECLPLPLVYALKNPQTKTRLIELVQKRGKTRSDLEEILRLTRRAHGIKKTQDYMQRRIDEGIDITSNLRSKAQELKSVLTSLAIFEEICIDT